MQSIVVLILGAFLFGALAEPLRYRQAQQIRTSARQTDSGVALQAEFGDSANEASEDQDRQNDERQPEQGVTPPSVYQSAPAPYPARGWVPLGQLLVLPVAVRSENVESTTTVESTTFNDSDATEETPTTESQATNGQLQEVETSEPKSKPSAAHKTSPGGPTIIIVKGKKVGELKVEAKQEAKEESKDEANDESTETNEATTETATDANDDANTTADPKSENLETTSEPDSEAVDVEKSNEEGKQATNAQAPAAPQTGSFFIQLPDGTFQRIVYVAQPQAAQQPQPQAALVQQPAIVPFQQLNQAPNPFGYNPITNPRIVTFSTQYNAW